MTKRQPPKKTMKKRKQNSVHLKVATLNISGAQKSPFEFHDGSEETLALHNTFTQLVNDYYNHNQTDIDMFYKGVNVLEKEYNEERYSPLYRDINPNLSFTLFEKYFYGLWNATVTEVVKNAMIKGYNKQYDLKHVVSEYNSLSQTNEQFKSFVEQVLRFLCRFDYLMLQAIKKVLGSITALKQYRTQRIQSIAQKVALIKKFLVTNQFDILFLQEMFPANWKMKGYTLYQKQTDTEITGILVKNKWVTSTTAVFSSTMSIPDPLSTTINDRFVGVELKHGILALCLHSSSKNKEEANGKPVNYQDQETMLLDYLQSIPMNTPYIVGIDANHHFVYGQIYPASETIATTYKARTAMQSQQRKIRQHKNDKPDKGTKDHILTNGQLQNGKILQVQNDKTQELEILPNHNHPFDHYAVSAEVIYPDHKKRIIE